ncbi:MAG: DEAD/DEAH box helicase [Alphaproteobacteria bacterium]|nr:DEAD/DEAH box helicase [Alphaproteobacteria bacterium]
MTLFSELGLAAPLLEALAAEGYERPTPIQTQAIPHVLTGRDLLGIAQTGTGKTAAFALPMLHRLANGRTAPAPRTCRALVLSPTRELASQIADSFRTYGRNLNLTSTVVFGGVSEGSQIRALAAGVDILVATPGRLLDLAQRNVVRFDQVVTFVLDEADQMLDMGFIQPIRRIVRMLPAVRQNLFFSATMPQEIGKLAGELLRNPVQVSVAPVATTAERVDQHVVFVDTAQKRSALATLLRRDGFVRTLVFTRTKHGADRVVRHLEAVGIQAAAIHGNKSQNQRERALEGFRTGRAPILVATDIAARGIDVDGVTHVINFDLPNVSESYVHRIGRTARAGAAGTAISLCAPEERTYLRDIEKLTRQKVPELRMADSEIVAQPIAQEPRAHRAPHPQKHPQSRGGSHHGSASNGGGHHNGGRRHGPKNEPRANAHAHAHGDRHARPQARSQGAESGANEMSGLSFMRPSRPQGEHRGSHGHQGGQRRLGGR